MTVRGVLEARTGSESAVAEISTCGALSSAGVRWAGLVSAFDIRVRLRIGEVQLVRSMATIARRRVP